MKTIEEVRDYLLENRVSVAGDLNLRGLDFSDFDGDVIISRMKVKKDLIQSHCEVQGDLHQTCYKVQGNLYQNSHKVQGDLNQSYHEVQGDYYSRNIAVKGHVEYKKPTKLLKEINAKELAKLGYKLKEKTK